jgi:hypothetical protein
MTLCQACKCIPFSLFTESPQSDLASRIMHHPSYQSLEKSATAGCNLCSLLYAKIDPIHRLGPHPCFEAIGYDPVLFPQRRAAVWKDQRIFLHLVKDRHKESGTSSNLLVCRFGTEGNVFNFNIEYSGVQIMMETCLGR